MYFVISIFDSASYFGTEFCFSCKGRQRGHDCGAKALAGRPLGMEIAHLVSTHLQSVVTQLRVDIHDDPYRQPPASVLALLRSFGVARRTALSYAAGGSCLPLLEPFLVTIRCEETSGVVTQRALSSVLAILKAGARSQHPTPPLCRHALCPRRRPTALRRRAVE